MNTPQENRRIFWMVRLLSAVGLATIIVLLGLVGHQISSIHTERMKLQTEQERLYQAAGEILRHSSEARGEIIAILDSNALAGKADAAERLVEMLDHLSNSANHLFPPDALREMDTLSHRLAEVERRAVAWRAQYDTAWQDVSQQRTMGQVRELITGLRGAVETLEGRERLQEAIMVKRWRSADANESAQLGQAILAEQDRKRNRGTGDLDRELAEVESLVELLGGEEQLDNLPNLKDNKLTPALDRLHDDINQFMESQPDGDVFIAQGIERLTEALFGRGYTKDETHQTIRIGTGGLYTLRQDILLLRREREKLNAERAALAGEIDVVVGVFMQAARAQSESLAEQVDHNLTSGWRRMMIIGACFSVLFVSLAWLISGAIRGQVGVIERAKSEAEAGHQTAQRLMQDLQESEERFSGAFQHAPIGVALVLPDGRWLKVNRALCDLVGYSESELLTRTFQDITHPDDLEADLEYVRRTLAGEMRTFQMEKRYVHRSGHSVSVLLDASLVRDGQGQPRYFISQIQDITERNQAALELEALHQQLMQASRQGGMAEIASNVLHNVGNVLNSVNISAMLASESVKKSKTAAGLTKAVGLMREHESDLGTYMTSDPKGKLLLTYLTQLTENLIANQESIVKELDSLRRNVDHIKEIVSMQQNYANVSGLKEIVNINDLVEDSLQMNINSLGRHGVELIREVEEVPLLNLDKHKLLQILVNLERNAKHACEDSGRPDKRLTVRAWHDGEWVNISVMDNGVGIPKENLTRIFNHGFTTRKDGHGFGLHSGALAAKEMGGDLTVHSDGPGQGATFTLRLPAATPCLSIL